MISSAEHTATVCRVGKNIFDTGWGSEKFAVSEFVLDESAKYSDTGSSQLGGSLRTLEPCLYIISDCSFTIQRNHIQGKR